MNDELNVPRDDWRRRYVLAGLLFFAHIAWPTLMLSFAVAKTWRFGVVSYVSHFTNWSWTLQILFFYGTALAPFVSTGFIAPDSAAGAWTRTVIVLGLWPLIGIVFSVMYAVSYLLGTGSHFLSDIFVKYPPEIVFIGNDLVHFWPIVTLLIFFIVYNKLVAFAFNDVLARRRLVRSAVRFTAFIVYQAYAGAGIAVAIYALLFDPRIVYKTNQTIAEGTLVLAISPTAPALSVARRRVDGALLARVARAQRVRRAARERRQASQELLKSTALYFCLRTRMACRRATNGASLNSRVTCACTMLMLVVVAGSAPERT